MCSGDASRAIPRGFDAGYRRIQGAACATAIPWGVRGRLPIFLAISPLLVTVAIVFECFPEFVPQRFQLLFLLLAMVAGWIGVGVSSFPRRWLKVLALILYPFLMVALLFLAVVRHLPIL